MKRSNIFRRQLFLCLFISALLLATGRSANSQKILAQSFLDTSYDSNYYGKMLEADRFYKQGAIRSYEIL